MAVCARREDFYGILNEWEALLPHTPANTIFVTPWWQRLWWERYGSRGNGDNGNGGGELQIIAVRRGGGNSGGGEDGNGELLGIAPLMTDGGDLSFLGDTDLFDYHDFLVRDGCETEFYGAMWASALRMDWDTMRLKSLRESSAALRLLPELAAEQGYKTEISEEDVSPFKTLQPSWDEYLSSLRKKDRHELRRKLRRLENSAAVNQYAYADADEIAAAMPDFFRLMRASSPDKDGFLTPEREAFFHALAQELAPRGQFKLFFMEIDGERAAACICFDYGGDFLLYNSGYDPEYSALSVGLLNKALCIRDAIENGRRAFDFLRGNERYKYNLGGENQTVHELVIHR